MDSRPALRRAILASVGMLAATGVALGQRPYGIDVSYWQGNISQTTWNTSIRNGPPVRDFAFVRAYHLGATGGSNDPYFAQNMTRARNAGLYAGAYHFASPVEQTEHSVVYAGQDPITEADAFASYAGSFIQPPYMRPVLDLELGAPSQVPVGAASMSDWANQWIDRVKSRTGVEAMIYTNTNWANQLTCAVATRTLWIANWSTPSIPQTGLPPVGRWDSCAPTHTNNWAFWQYGGGPISGVSSSTVDMNVFQGTLDELRDFVIATIARSPATLSQTIRRGQSPSNQSFTVRNSATTGNGRLLYDIDVTTTPAGGTWLAVDPVSGNSTGELDTITVSYPTPNMAIGTYNGTITISSAQAASQSIAVTLIVKPSPGDLDSNGYVDSDDFTILFNCMTGPNQGPPGTGCADADIDADSDVDQVDFGILQKCTSGTYIPPDPNCAS